MSTLQVANIHLESTANNRIQYSGSNSFVIVAGGANTLTVNSTSISTNSISLNGTEVDGVASQADAEAGTNTTKLMTPERVRQATEIKLSSAISTASGNAVLFSNIPANVKRISVMLNRVSLSTIATIAVQIGTAAGLQTTNYEAISAIIENSATTNTANSTGYFPIYYTNSSSVSIVEMVISRLPGNTWITTYLGLENTGVRLGAGRVVLSGELTQLRIALTSSANFDNGSINISWEF